MNDSEHPRLAPWIHRHPRLARVIGVILFVLAGGLALFFVVAFLFVSPEGKIAQGIVLAALSWLWEHWLSLVILAVLLRAGVLVSSIFEERERIAQERHEQILEALHQIRDELRDERELREILDKPER